MSAPVSMEVARAEQILAARELQAACEAARIRRDAAREALKEAEAEYAAAFEKLDAARRKLIEAI